MRTENPILHNKPTTGQERTQGIAPFLFVYTSEREKEPTTQPTLKAKPQSQENKTKSRKAGKAGSQAGELDERRKERTRGEKKKTKGETRLKPLIRLTIHAHKKPHKPRKYLNPYKHTSAQ